MQLLIGKVNAKATEVIACTFINTSVAVNCTFFISNVRNLLLGEMFVTHLISLVVRALDVSLLFTCFFHLFFNKNSRNDS